MSTNFIHILPPHTAERIAAGEVVERPASVIKELVENSIDAGARAISVHLEEGGRSLIQIEDNGCGMSPNDLNLCLYRHATSKISSLDDLERLTSLGFRGEALASVAAVASVELTSRTQNGSSSFLLRSLSIQEKFQEATACTYGHYLGSSHGTKIKVENIFSQIPARLKFLKSTRTEVAAAKEWIEKLSLTHPEIHFKLSHDSKTALDLPVQKEKERIQLLFAEYDTFPLKYETLEHEGFLLRAYWLEGMSAPSTKNIIQIVNQRALKDRLIQQALISPFKQSLLPGRFPGIVLFVECDPGQVDFNVHPTKMEIRFENSSHLFHGIQKLGEKLLGFQPTSQHYYQNIQREREPLSARMDLFHQSQKTTPSHNSMQPQNEFHNPNFEGKSLPPTEFHSSIALPIEKKRAPEFIENSQYCGILLSTYIALESPAELILIDQHAAHERIRYEKLKQQVLNDKNIPSQTLLIPHTLSFNKENTAETLLKIEKLIPFGFEIELFQENTLLIRSIPSIWGLQNIPQRIKNLLENISLDVHAPVSQKNELIFDEHLFEKLASEACHSSVRARDRLERFEAESLIQQLFQCEHPWNCPHGRPTLVRIPEKKIEEWFLRKL